MLDIEEILATERMFDQNKLDVRTITMGISLLGCVSDDEKTLNRKIYDTICTKAEHLTEVSHDISREYGVPIINRRISVRFFRKPFAFFGNRSVVFGTVRSAGRTAATGTVLAVLVATSLILLRIGIQGCLDANAGYPEY